MSSPSRNDSPTQDEHAKRKRDEKDVLEKHTESLTSEAETVPPKKIKPEVESAVTKAEVKHIQRNLKTMPLEDGKAQEVLTQGKDMDDVESDAGSTGDHDKTMTDSTSQVAHPAEAPDDLESSISDLENPQLESETKPAQPTRLAISPTGSTAGSTQLGGGFGNTSSVSPFANVAPSTNIFGSSSSTLKGLGATSSASPFASVEKSTSVFDKAPATSSGSGFSSGGFGNTSTKSPFATMAGSTNVFGGSDSAKSVFGGDSTKNAFGGDSAKSVFGGGDESAKDVFGQSSSFGSGSAFGSNGNSTESTAGSVFGARSVLGSTSGTSPSANKMASSLYPSSPFSTSKSPSPAPTSSFSTFGAKQGLDKEGSFASGSFIDQEASQEKSDFGSLLSQNNGDQDGEGDDQEEGESNFVQGIFTQADQVEVHTGEEDEVNLFQTKGKLYADTDKNHSWKERGKGTFKVNIGRKNTKIARLVMRTDGALRLILNISVFPDMSIIITGDKYVRFVGIEEGKPVSLLLKVKDAAAANDVVRSIERAQYRQKHGLGTGVALKE